MGIVITKWMHLKVYTIILVSKEFTLLNQIVNYLRLTSNSW